MIAFVDESRRASRYALAAVVLGTHRQDHARHEARSLLLPGEGRFHTSKEKAPRRREALARLRQLGVEVMAVATSMSRGDREEAARRRCFAELLTWLVEADVTMVVVERRDEFRDRQERRFLSSVLSPAIGHRQLKSTEDACLWWADVAAWWSLMPRRHRWFEVGSA